MVLIRWSSRHRILIVSLLMFVFLGIWGWIPPSFRMPACQIANNAAWISVDWTSQTPDERLVSKLVSDARTHQIHYLFPFTAYVKQDGSVSASHTYATEFVQMFRQYDVNVALLAWIGVPIRNTKLFGLDGWVDLHDPIQRARIVQFAVDITQSAQFDGVHLDVEHVNDGDADYLILLEEVKQALGSQRRLSVAANNWLPGWLNWLPVVGGHKWSAEYMRAVARRVDQIVVMSYDSMMPTDWLYRFWMREQVRGITRSLADSKIELLFGISVSRESTFTHRPVAENLRSGLSGLCAGLTPSVTQHKAISGVAIYASWEANEGDWQVWHEWLQGQ